MDLGPGHCQLRVSGATVGETDATSMSSCHCHISSSDGVNKDRAVTGHPGLQVCAADMTQTLAANSLFPKFPKFDSWKGTGLSGHDVGQGQVSQFQK